METPLVSLITCTLGRQDKLLRLLHSLQQQESSQFELILVDQNAPGFLDAALEPFKSRFTIEHLHTAKGLSLGRNIGLQAARGSLVAFPDDDCWYRPHTLHQFIGLFDVHPDLDFITGRTFDAANNPSLSPTLEIGARIGRDNYLVCGNSNSIFARIKAVRRIGGFDERLGVGAATPFQSGEESDLILSAIAAHMKLAYFPELIVHHDQVDTSNATTYVDRAAKYGAGYGAILHKHDFGIGYLCIRVLRSMVRSLLSVAQLQWTEANYKRSWALGIWSGYWRWSNQPGMAVSPAKKESTMPALKFLVTVTYSTRWDLLRHALASAQSEGIDRAVVVDNGAAVDIAALAHVEFGDFVEVVTLGRNTGSAGGFKAGIQRALDLGACYLLLLDDDNEMQSGCLAALTAAYQECRANTPEDKLAILAYRSDRQTDAAINLSSSGMQLNRDAFFGFHILDVPFKLFRRTPWGQRWIVNRPVLPLVVVDVAPYSGMYFHRAVPELLGLPDERFFLYADDTDFSYRLTRAGGSIVLATDACLRDQELSWNVKERFSNTFDALLWGDGDFRAFYSTRNNAYFERCASGSNRLLRSLNRIIYLLLLQTRAVMAGRTSRFRLLRRAVHDGEAGRLGEHAEFPLQQTRTDSGALSISRAGLSNYVPPRKTLNK